MAAFIATYTDSQGRERSIQLEAGSLAKAKRNLRQRGIRPTSVEPTIQMGQSTNGNGAAVVANRPSSGRPAATRPTSRGSSLAQLLEAKPGIREKALFASKLSAMVTAGVPIVRGLSLLSTQQKIPLFKRALIAIAAEVNQGGSIGPAMRKWPQIFDRLSIAMVEAGEAGGILDETLGQLAKLLEANAKLQGQIKGAMGYPISVLVIAILVFLGMTIFIIPVFSDIFKQLGADLPWFTQVMINLSDLLRSSFTIVLVSGLAGAAVLFVRFYQTPVGRRRVDSLTLRLPLFGDLILKTATAQFCRTFSSLSRAGVPILQSLEISRDTISNSILSDAIDNSRIEVMEGIPLSVALARKKVFPDMAVNMLVIGEETGGFSVMLSKVADFYEDEVDITVKVLTSMLEPAMIVFVGGIVCSILVAMYLPMFTMFDKIR